MPTCLSEGCYSLDKMLAEDLARDNLSLLPCYTKISSKHDTFIKHSQLKVQSPEAICACTFIGENGKITFRHHTPHPPPTHTDTVGRQEKWKTVPALFTSPSTAGRQEHGTCGPPHHDVSFLCRIPAPQEYWGDRMSCPASLLSVAWGGRRSRTIFLPHHGRGCEFGYPKSLDQP